MEIPVLCSIGCEIAVAQKRIPLFVDKETDTVVNSLADYRCDSFDALKEKLVADGVCVYGHQSLIQWVAHELTGDDKCGVCVLALGAVGSELSEARQRIPLFCEEDLETVKESLKGYRSYSDSIFNYLLSKDKICVYGDAALVVELIMGLVTLKKLNNERELSFYYEPEIVNSLFSKPDDEKTTESLPGLDELMASYENYDSKLFSKAINKKFCDELQKMIESGADVDAMSKVVSFMKEKGLYPSKERMKQLFEAAFAIYESMPEGASKQRFNDFCWTLKDMLYFVVKRKN